jgi:hypothetical protein
MEISGFHTTRQWRKNFLFASAVVVVEYADARGTEAVKLSVKLLSGLALIALVAVGVIGLSHSASAAVDGKVYVTNVASGLTNEASPPTGRTNASTVYGTYASTATTGTSARDIIADSNKFIVTVVDADLNTTVTVTDDNSAADFDFQSGTGGSSYGTNIVLVNDPNGTGFEDIGDQFRVILTDATSPIIGTASDIKLIDDTTDTELVGLEVASIFAFGDGVAAKPIITISVIASPTLTNFRVVYPSSDINTITASLKSVVDTTGSVVTLTETGRNTGRFEGFVRVSAHTSTFTTGVDGGTTGSPATVAAVGGPLSLVYTDAVTSGSATKSPRSTTISLDVTPPTATITAPITGSESQNRLPTFTGTVTDNQSGLDESSFELRIDRDENDADNNNLVITPGNTSSGIGSVGQTASVVLATSVVDGASSFPFSYTETTPLPDNAVNPDHTVDFQIRVADLAGNYGFSDSDTSVGYVGTAGAENTTGAGAGRHGNQPHTIRIDQVIPNIESASSGTGLDQTGSTPAPKANVRDTIRVIFDGKIKESSVSAADFQVVLSDSAGTFVPASIIVNGTDVYLDLDSTIPSDNTPTVKLQGTIQDLAGNSTAAGSAVASDDLAPVITVARSTGSGTGTGSEAADSLTNDKLTVTVSSDENLQGPPAFFVTDLLTTPSVGNVNNGTLGVAQGGNTWTLIVAKGASLSGNRALKVTATDSAGNTATSGDDTTKVYTLDKEVAAATSTPSSATTQSNPFLTTAMSGDQSTISIVSATLDDVDVTSGLIASADSKTFFFQPTSALTNAEHTYVVKVMDAAGNTKTITSVFTKTDRTDFVVTLFAGWNAISFPSNPLDTSIDTVLSNTGVKQAVAYDATTPSQPWRIASKVGSAAFTSQTTPGLDSVMAGPGYWVETSDFEDQKVSLEGPTGPGDARPGLTTIATGNGWNLVGVVDQSRSQTQGLHKGLSLQRPNSVGTDAPVTAGTYFNTVNNGRAYTFDTVTSKFWELASGNDVKIGTGIWVFISPQTNGKLPHIVP